MGKTRINRQPWHKLFADGLCSRPQLVDLRPGSLRIDVIVRHGGDSAPVIDPCREQSFEGRRVQVRRRLDIHLRRENQARHCDRPEVLVEARLRRNGHGGAGFGTEILNDYFLHVAVTGMQRAQRQHRLDSLASRLADADENAAGERHRERTGSANGFQAYPRPLVRTAVMGTAALAQAIRRRLQHQPR